MKTIKNLEVDSLIQSYCGRKTFEKPLLLRSENSDPFIKIEEALLKENENGNVTIISKKFFTILLDLRINHGLITVLKFCNKIKFLLSVVWKNKMLLQQQGMIIWQSILNNTLFRKKIMRKA